MNVVIAQPPMLDAIDAAFPKRGPNVIYAFGDTIYNPSGQFVSPALIAHEEAHGARQRVFRLDEATTGVEHWWRHYIEDAEFRYREEVHGHAAECLAQVSRDRERNSKLLVSTTLRLLAPLYAYGEHRPTFSNALRDLSLAVEWLRRA